MIIRKLNRSAPFATKDGSTIRSLLDRANAPVQNQSLAEATIPPGAASSPSGTRSRSLPLVPKTSMRRFTSSNRIKAPRALSVTRILPCSSKSTAWGLLNRS